MMPDDQFDEALRSLAGHAARTSRLADVADIRRRGDAHRKRRLAATAALGVALVGILTAGVAVARPNNWHQNVGPSATAVPSVPTSATPTSPSPAPTTSTSPTSSPTTPTSPTSSPAGPTDPVLSGERRVAIVRVQAFESALSIVNGRLTEVDDNSGRSLFVPTPLGQNSYLIKAYAKPTDKPVCWQATQTQTTAPLTVKGAPCDAKNPSQRFTITAEAKGTYAISSASAFLQYFPTSGLILEELGDAPLVSTFRLVDNGPAPTTGG